MRKLEFCLALVLILAPVVYFWGFTVDDAWILAGHAYALAHPQVQPALASAEGITPLLFTEVVALLGRLFSGTEPRLFFTLARVLGVCAWLASLWLIYFRLPNGRARAWFLALLPLLLCGAAWAGAGLSAPLAGICLLLFYWRLPGADQGASAELHRSSAPRWSSAPRSSSAPRALLSAGVGALAYWLRPELLPFVCALGLARCLRMKRFLPEFYLQALFFVLGLALRKYTSGAYLPLALLAKTPEVDAGFYYAYAGLFFGGPFLLLLLVLGKKQGREAAFACAVFALSVAFAGGDWMPLFRLFTPLLPWLLWVLAENLEPKGRVQRSLAGLGWLFYLALSCFLLVELGSDSRAVVKRRLELVEAARPLLAQSQRIAAVDIGWVLLSSSASIFDLAGVTEPQVARLRGGHTAKHVPRALFEAQNADTWIVRLARPLSATEWASFQVLARDAGPRGSLPAYFEVDRRLLAAGSAEEYVARAQLFLPGLAGGYLVLMRGKPSR